MGDDFGTFEFEVSNLSVSRAKYELVRLSSGIFNTRFACGKRGPVISPRLLYLHGQNTLTNVVRAGNFGSA